MEELDTLESHNRVNTKTVLYNCGFTRFKSVHRGQEIFVKFPTGMKIITS